MSARHKAYLYLTVVAVIWGIAGPVIKYTLSYFSPDVFLTYRFFLTSLLLVPILFVHHPKIFSTLRRLSAAEYRMLVICSLLGSTANLGLLFWGFSLTTALDGSIINAVSPVFVTLAGFYILHEHITARERFGQFLALLGTLLIFFQPVFEAGKLSTGSLLGNFLVVLANLAWTGYAILTKKQLRHHLSPLILTTSMFLLGFLSMSVITVIMNTPYRLYNSFINAPLSAHAGVLFMALVSGGLAYFLFEKGQKTIEASEANIFLYLPPLITTPLAYLWLGEPVTSAFVIGGLIIAGGVILAQTKSHRL